MRRITRHEAAAVGDAGANVPILNDALSRLSEAHRAALKALRGLLPGGQQDQATLAKRLRDADLSPFADVTLLVDDLVRLGLVERETRYPRRGLPRVRLRLTPDGQQVIERLFGSPWARERRLIALIEASLPGIVRPAVAEVLATQRDALRSGQASSLPRASGPPLAVTHSRYETALRFLAWLGALPPGQTAEWKAVAASLFPEIGGSKLLAGWQSLLEDVVAASLGGTLEAYGILGEDTLYYVPLAGPIAVPGPDGPRLLPGRFPALSNLDILATPVFETPARWLLLVENRACLLALARRGGAMQDCLVLGTDGMPKQALLALLERLPPLPILLWVDWDLGGVRIARFLRARRLGLPVVPHPGLPGTPAPAELEAYLHTDDPVIADLAAAICRHGEVEQERALPHVETLHLERMTG
jgi:DNA-binding MarR family transcriptional regulator